MKLDSLNWFGQLRPAGRCNYLCYFSPNLLFKLAENLIIKNQTKDPRLAAIRAMYADLRHNLKAHNAIRSGFFAKYVCKSRMQMVWLKYVFQEFSIKISF